jgi:tRNA threonylcarbamoyladenosine biosynthesis protein TsaE
LESIKAQANGGGSSDISESLVVALNGHLGSGKTTFVQSIARHLGINEIITSPTFVIMKKYNIKKADFPFKKMVHIDAYRLDEGRELGTLDFERLVEDKDNLILIEWAEKVREGMPKDIVEIDFEYIDEDKRKIIFK